MGSFHSRSNDTEEDNKVNEEMCTEYRFRPFVFKQVDYGEGIWPRARSGHKIVSTSNEIYSYGGYNPDSVGSDLGLDDDVWLQSKPLFRELWRYNVSKNEWSKVPAANIPNVLASNAVILQGTVLLVFGGTGVPFGGHCSNSLFVCDLSEEVPSFREIDVTGDAPDAQYGQAAFVHKKYFYVIGGTTGYDFSCDVHRLHLSTGLWEVHHLNRGIPPDPPGRYRHELGLQLDKSKVFVFGGGTAHFSYGFQEIPVFDLKCHEWSVVMTIGDPKVEEHGGYPKHRRFHSLVQAPGGNEVFITGGESGVVLLCDSWKLNLESLQWTRIDSLKLDTPLYFHASTLSPQGKLYVFGGITYCSRTNTLLSSWLKIPTLQDMCWDAILFYKFLDHLPNDTLRQSLPPKFLKRLD